MKKKQLTIRLPQLVDFKFEELAAKEKKTKTELMAKVLNTYAVGKEKEENILKEIQQLRESFSEVANVLEGVLEYVVANHKKKLRGRT
jgi:plasmid replication initiation protein